MIKAYAWVQGQRRGLTFIKPTDLPAGAELHELQSVDAKVDLEPVAFLMEADGRKAVPVMSTDEKAITFYVQSGYSATPLVRAE